MAQKAKFLIDGVDFSDCIKQGGLKWKKYDLEAEQSGRTLDGQMHRKRIARKRQLTLSCRRMTDTRAQQLGTALDKEFVQISYPDLLFGLVSKTFYGTELEAAVWAERDGVLYWDAATFQLTER